MHCKHNMFNFISQTLYPPLKDGIWNVTTLSRAAYCIIFHILIVLPHSASVTILLCIMKYWLPIGLFLIAHFIIFYHSDWRIELRIWCLSACKTNSFYLLFFEPVHMSRPHLYINCKRIKNKKILNVAIAFWLSSTLGCGKVHKMDRKA